MQKYTMLMNKIVKQIQNENPNLIAAEWAQDFEEYIVYSLAGKPTENDLLTFVKCIKFNIEPSESGIFKDVEVDFIDIFADVHFEYSFDDGVQYEITLNIAEALRVDDEEQIFSAIEELAPEIMDPIIIQWTFWTLEQKEKFIPSLEKFASQKLESLKEEITLGTFKKYEETTKEKILSIAKKKLEENKDLFK